LYSRKIELLLPPFTDCKTRITGRTA